MLVRLSRKLWIGLVFACLASLPLSAAIKQNIALPPLPQPSVELSPGEVVKIVINALADNDRPYPDAGITTTFAFASPANKVNTGPLEKFSRMVKSNVYGIMVGHVASEFSEVIQDDNNAYQMVQLTGRNGQQVLFAFRLSKQLDGRFANMWMTDAVWPVSHVLAPGQGA